MKLQLSLSPLQTRAKYGLEGVTKYFGGKGDEICLSVTPRSWQVKVEVLENIDDAEGGLRFNREKKLRLLYVAEADVVVTVGPLPCFTQNSPSASP